MYTRQRRDKAFIEKTEHAEDKVPHIHEVQASVKKVRWLFFLWILHLKVKKVFLLRNACRFSTASSLVRLEVYHCAIASSLLLSTLVHFLNTKQLFALFFS